MSGEGFRDRSEEFKGATRSEPVGKVVPADPTDPDIQHVGRPVTIVDDGMVTLPNGQRVSEADKPFVANPFATPCL